MSVIDRLVRANAEYVKTFPGPRPLQPALKPAVVACMDSRLALFGALGLQIGDAHLIRNAGGIVDEEVLRSSGPVPSWRVPGFTDLDQSVRDSVQRVKDCPWLPSRLSVRGFVFDVRTAKITEVH